MFLFLCLTEGPLGYIGMLGPDLQVIPVLYVYKKAVCGGGDVRRMGGRREDREKFKTAFKTCNF